MAKAKTKPDWAVRLLRGLDKVTERSRRNEKATSTYWNGDDWGSIDGIRDAANWMERQRAEYIRRFMSKLSAKTSISSKKS